eukprot:3650656-Rhodomonas_salina.1
MPVPAAAYLAAQGDRRNKCAPYIPCQQHSPGQYRTSRTENAIADVRSGHRVGRYLYRRLSPGSSIAQVSTGQRVGGA